MAVRRKELLEVVSPPLLEYLCENAATMVMDKATSVTVSDILASACGDLRPAMTAVAQLANQELVAGGTDGQVSRNTMIQQVWPQQDTIKAFPERVCWLLLNTLVPVDSFIVCPSVPPGSSDSSLLMSFHFPAASHSRTSSRTPGAEVAHRAGRDTGRGRQGR